MATRTKRTTRATPAVIANDVALDAEIAADARNEAANPDALARITATAHDMKRLQAVAEEYTEKASEASTEARRLGEQVLPSMMDEAGVTDLGLDDDTRIERTEETYASIAKANEAAATAWLEKNGYGSIIKMQLVIPIDKGDVKTANKIRALLRKERVAFEERAGVHAQTLKAFVRESLTMTPPRKLPPSITHHTQPLVVLKAVRKQKPRKSVLV